MRDFVVYYEVEVFALRAEEFLQTYRVIEETLSEKYAGKPVRHSSVVMEYLGDPESVPVREQLDMMREMRNILSHNADADGQMVFEPSAAVLKSLEDILAYIRKPPLVTAFATPAQHLLCADMSTRALPLMRMMDKRGFSHIPVLERGRLIGVFSTRTVFSRMAQDPDFDIRANTTLADFRTLLPLDAHRGETYRFMSADTSIVEARQAFSTPSAPNRRLSAIFITQNGTEKESLLGMLTPWDAMGFKTERNDHI